MIDYYKDLVVERLDKIIEILTYQEKQPEKSNNPIFWDEDDRWTVIKSEIETRARVCNDILEFIEEAIDYMPNSIYLLPVVKDKIKQIRDKP